MLDTKEPLINRKVNDEAWLYTREKTVDLSLFKSDIAVRDLEAAYQSYIEFGDRLGWSRACTSGEIVDFHPLKTKTVFCPLVEALNDLYNKVKAGKGAMTYEDLSEMHQNIQNGHGRFYEPATKEYRRDKGFLVCPIFLHFAPKRVYMQHAVGNCFDYQNLSDAFWGVRTSVIEPTEGLKIEEVEKLVFYALYLTQAEASYNHKHSHAGIYKQNCSEFIYNAFAQIGYRVGHKQRMDSLNINTLGGGLRRAEWLRGLYRPGNIVITPKSVMQTAVPYKGSVPDPKDGLKEIDMRVVRELDHMKVADPVSEQDLWNEWERGGYLFWTFRWVKTLLGNPFSELSKESFETHSKDGLTRTVRTQWPYVHMAGGAILGVVATMWHCVARTHSEENSEQEGESAHDENEQNES